MTIALAATEWSVSSIPSLTHSARMGWASARPTARTVKTPGSLPPRACPRRGGVAAATSPSSGQAAAAAAAAAAQRGRQRQLRPAGGGSAPTSPRPHSVAGSPLTGTKLALSASDTHSSAPLGRARSAPLARCRAPTCCGHSCCALQPLGQLAISWSAPPRQCRGCQAQSRRCCASAPLSMVPWPAFGAAVHPGSQGTSITRRRGIRSCSP